jgi:hypothetical protein
MAFSMPHLEQRVKLWLGASRDQMEPLGRKDFAV